MPAPVFHSYPVYIAITLDKPPELLKPRVDPRGGYNSNAVNLNLAEIKRDQGQQAVNQLIAKFHLDEVFGIAPDSPLPGGW